MCCGRQENSWGRVCSISRSSCHRPKTVDEIVLTYSLHIAVRPKGYRVAGVLSGVLVFGLGESKEIP